MAQKTSGSSRSGSSTKKPTSTARHPGQSSGSSRGTSSAKSGSQSKNGSSGKNSAASRGNASKGGSAAKNSNTSKAAQTETPAVQERKPIRREVGAVVLLFFAMVAFITYFPVEAWLLDGLRKLCFGLFGWGYYVVCPTLLLAACILGFHKGRPVTARTVCALLLPWLFGAFVHSLFAGGERYIAEDITKTVTGLWAGGLDAASRCGGVLSGLTAEALVGAISVFGAAPLFGIVFLVLFLVSSRLTPGNIAKLLAGRPRLSYLPEDDYDEDDFEPLDFFEPSRKERDSLKKQDPFRHFDVEVDNGDLFSSAKGESTERKSSRRSPGRKTRLEKEAPAAEAETPLDELPAEKKKKGPRKHKAELYDVEKEDELFQRPARSVDTAGVEPVSVEEAAAIAGVQLESAAMDGPAAPKQEKIRIDKDFEAAMVAQEIEAAQAEEKPAYTYPPVSLLHKGKPGRDDSKEETDKNWKRLESALVSFGVSAHIVGVTRGPTVSRYDLELEQGVKLSKITGLADDIALSLGVESVRIAPVTDMISTVGVEVPNRKTTIVYLRDIIESPAFEKAASKISFAVGKDIAGNAIVGNIAKLPHLLVAGTTGSGKSVFINSLILSILYKSTPDEVRLIMIDPKMVELGIYNGMPHLYVPVVTDPKKAAGALQWSVVEMLKRYRIFSEVGMRDLAGYNSYQRKHGEPTMPQVVIIVDELADLMMVASKEVEESICRVAQMGRAAGMHLVVATQRPSADVITGLIKSNIPGRIGFTVSSAMESRIILGASGAEKLLGNGDMIYAPMNSTRFRVQGAFVSDEEREDIINFIKKDAEAAYSDEIMEEIERAAADKKDKGAKSAAADSGEEGLFDDYDELLPQAVDVVLDMKQASVSSLQRRLKLGYSRAARIVDQMEELGVVGPSEGSKPRKVLISRQQWQEMQYATGVAPADSIVPVDEDDVTFAALPEDDEEDVF